MDTSRWAMAAVLVLAICGQAVADEAADKAAEQQAAARKAAWAAMQAAYRAEQRKAVDLYTQVRPYAAADLSHENSVKDLLRGFVTHSQAADGKYVAYVFLRWGDLNRQIPRCSAEHYSNWDGYVAVGEGSATVVGEYAFDDASAAPGSETPQVAPERLNRWLSRGPREGSGRDRLKTWQGASTVEWQSGVVGATDGLLVRLDLPGQTATVGITAGKFITSVEVTPLPADKAAQIQAALAKAAARRQRHTKPAP